MATEKVQLLIDFDGTIVESESLRFECIARELARHGIQLTNAKWSEMWEFATTTGRSLSGTVIAAWPAIISEKRMRAINSEIFEETLAAAPRDYARTWISEAAKAGVKPIVVTNSSERRVDTYLKKHAIDHLIRMTIGRETLPPAARKPSPAGYVLAKSLSQCEPVLAVEDSNHGVLAAIAANLRVIQVTNSMTGPHCQRLGQCIIHSAEASQLSLSGALARVSHVAAIRGSL